ncbi:biotin transporter BioY [Clostridium tetanomorphum]|uniref:Biotin transporter n=2 Tax=Clostridium tetanomorphum TaxID=1553 RepID=A0A923J1B9_CLOTT|nr:biotin transporter BioY [Clostridium tetanomorphum]
MFAALTAIGAFIKIPIPYVPFTLQFLFCAFAGMILGARLGALSQIIYVAIGLAGIPVFTEGGGIGYVFKPTFGYLIGFIVAAYVIGKFTERIKELTILKAFLIILSGLFFVYLFGVLYLYRICNLYLGKSMSLYTVVFYGFIVCVLGDAVLSFITAIASAKIVKAMRKIGLCTYMPTKG